MWDTEWEAYGDMRKAGGSMTAVLLLATLLVGIFFLTLGAYGYFSAVGDGSLTGELPDAVLALRGLIENNDTVAVFLGLSREDSIETMVEKTERAARIQAAAEAYIKEKQG
jgi:hypothetical protein